VSSSNRPLRKGTKVRTTLRYAPNSRTIIERSYINEAGIRMYVMQDGRFLTINEFEVIK
jgi:hypothetical protein